jgi:preprotein translocase subunit SecB
MKESNGKKTISKKISPDSAHYNEFIKGLTLKSLVLRNCKAELFLDVKSLSEKPISISIEGKSAYEIKDTNAFSMIDAYKIIAKIDNKRLFQFVLEYFLTFHSAPNIDENCLELYKKSSLHLHTYPFARETVQSLSGKMGVTPLVLPLIKFISDKEH